MIIIISLKTYAQKALKVSIGDRAYNIVGTDENENSVDISDYRDKYVLLNFTATNCGPCWKTYDIMNEMQENYSNDLKIISFHFDDEIEKWYLMAEKMDIDFKCISIWYSQEKPKIIDIYQIDGFPYFYLINKDGLIIDKWFGNQRNKMVRSLRKNIK